MPLIDVDDVQQWLEQSKHNLDHNDELPEEPFLSELVRSRLSTCGIDTSSWITPETTPTLIRGIVGMLVAAQRYNKAYSETDDDAGNAYANKLEENAHMLIDGICAGTIDLIGVDDDPIDTGFGSILFYPDDSVGVLNPDEGVRFTMGSRF